LKDIRQINILRFIRFSLSVILISALFACNSFNRTSWPYVFPGTKRYSIVKTAEKYLGVRYKFGGTNPAGFDCSGFSSYVYKTNGFLLAHSAQQQFADGKRIGIRKAKPGDLVFFRIYGWKISHVGIYMGDYKFIHAPSRGKHVSFDDIRKDYWRKRYAGTVTYF
jgi:cell wall-associated NlpC family hydrolase